MPKARRYHTDDSVGSGDKRLSGDKPDPKTRGFYHDEVEEFQHDKDEVLLSAGKSAKGRKSWKTIKSKEVEEIFPIAEDSDLESKEDEEVDESDADMSSDLDSNEDYLPSADAWGKKRSTYYNTDYVDKDYGGFSGSEEEEAALLEETEAKALQRKHMELMSEEDFHLDLPSTSDKQAVEETVEKVSFDMSSLSAAEKVKVFKAQSSEYFELLEQFKLKKELLHRVNQLLALVKDQPGWSEYPLLKYLGRLANILCNYVVVLNFYFLVKMKKESVRNHPVMDHIKQWQKLLKTAEAKVPIEDELINGILERLNSGESIDQLLGAFRLKKPTIKASYKNLQKQTKPKLSSEIDTGSSYFEDDGKRGITYQMSKNKGLMPHRKKEQNNPRVKHKLKFRKALIKRRSQVPDCKTEMERYAGEARGIKIGVIRSRKLQ